MSWVSKKTRSSQNEADFQLAKNRKLFQFCCFVLFRGKNPPVLTEYEVVPVFENDAGNPAVSRNKKVIRNSHW